MWAMELFHFLKAYMQGVRYLFNGILLQYTGTTTAVTQSEYSRIQIQDHFLARFQVAIVGRTRQILRGKMQCRSSKQFSYSLYLYALPFGICEPQVAHLFLVATLLRTRIRGVLCSHLAVPKTNCLRCFTIR